MTQPHHVPDAIIIIFGAAVRPDGQPSGTLRRRVDAALRFASRFAAPLFIPTGAQGRYGAAEAQVMADLLRESGIDTKHIILEEAGVDTLSSVVAVARIIRGLCRTGGDGQVPVFAATSGYHLPRCVLLLRLAGVPARAVPPPMYAVAGGFGQRWYWRLREVPAIPYDVVLIVWHRLRGCLGPRSSGPGSLSPT